MSWFDTSSFSKYSKYAKTALKTAQQNIDKVLDISENDYPSIDKKTDFSNEHELISTPIPASFPSSPSTTTTTDSLDDLSSQAANESNSFFGSFLQTDNNDAKTKSDDHLPSASAPSSSIQVSHLKDCINETAESTEQPIRKRGKLKDKPRGKRVNLSKVIDLIKALDEFGNKPKVFEHCKSIESNDSEILTNMDAMEAFNSNLRSTNIEENSINEDNSKMIDDKDNVDTILFSSETKQCERSDEPVVLLEELNREVSATIAAVDKNETSKGINKLEHPFHVCEIFVQQNGKTLDSSKNKSVNPSEDFALLVQAGSKESTVDSPELDNRKQDCEVISKVENEEDSKTLKSEVKCKDFPDEPDNSKMFPVNHYKNEEKDMFIKDTEKLQNIINTREKKLLELSRENMHLQESVAVYKMQLDQAEHVNAKDDEEMETLRKEFTKRIGESDQKLQCLIKEKDSLKQKLQDTEERLTQTANQEVSALRLSLLEKEEKIQGLLNEGEALSRKELEANNRIKKLRLKMKDLTGKNETHLAKIENLEKEVEYLKETNERKTRNEERIEAELKKLEGITDSQEDEISALKDKLDDTEEKYRAMESTLQNAYSEISKLNLEIAHKASEMQETVSAFQAKEELEKKLKDMEKTCNYGKEKLLTQLEDLQIEYSHLEQQSGRREDKLKIELQDLHKRLEEGETRNQELSSSVTAATKPLLRQIEHLQSSHASQMENWERVEKNLTDRLVSMQHQLVLSKEKERSSTEIATELKSKYKVLNQRHEEIKKEIKKMEGNLEKELTTNKEEKFRWQKQKLVLENQISKLQSFCDDLTKEKISLEDELATHMIRNENEMFQLNAKLNQQKLSQQHVAQLHPENSQDSANGKDAESDYVDGQSSHLSSDWHPRTMSTTSSLYDGFQNEAVSNVHMRTTTTASLEYLQSHLRKKEGEVYLLQEEILSLEKTKASLAQELVSLSTKVEQLEDAFNENTRLKEQLRETQSRYSAVLQMYGEKEEEAEELRMDLEDYKNMYKDQIQDLLTRR